MKKIVLWAIVAIIAVVLLIQLLPLGRDHTNPPVVQEPQWDSAQTRALAMGACGDCHSNETKWPWYSNIAPMSWIVANHVQEARGKLNFSEWNRPQDDAEDAAEIVSDGEMPPGYYRFMHKSAQLTDAERQTLVDGLLATFGGELGGEGGEEGGD